MRRFAGAALSAAAVFSCAPVARADATAGPTYSPGEVRAFSFLSGAFAIAGFAAPVPAPYGFSFQFSAGAPLVAVSPASASAVESLQAAFAGGTVGLAAARRANSTWDPYRTLAAELSLHQALYATYATYRELRERASSDPYRESFRPESGAALTLAPFDGAIYLRPMLFAPLGLLGGLAGAGVAVRLTDGSGTWSASGFARDASLGVALAWNAGVTEEAFDRGVVYEELEWALPRWAARTADMIFFAGLHVPGELSAGNSTSSIVLGACARAASGFLFDAAYDEGGLRESIPLHAAWDAIVFIAGAATGQRFLGNAVAPEENGKRRAETSSRAPATPILVPLAGGAF